jgi:superfamily II DNA or RNA helicase
MALSEYLIPHVADNAEEVTMQAPTYAIRCGFRFNLKCLTNDNSDLFMTPGEPFDVQELQNRTSLDHAQAIALQHALTHNLALIQGPPGTGKSYVGVALMRTLLDNKLSTTHPTGADFGPILVVTYTNHALDQTLEHLVKAGVEQIVRIGGRSKSEIRLVFSKHYLDSLKLRGQILQYCKRV